MNTPTKIVILGGGFAGVYSALSIMRNTEPGSVMISIINKTNYFLFTPMLHEVATGGLGHHQIVESIRGIIYKTPIRFFESSVLSVDVGKKEVNTNQGVHPYDMLIVAIGATTNFFGTPGAEEHSVVLKNLSDALLLREKITENFEKASRETDTEKQKQLLSFTVVGGGATGVELSAEIAEYTHKTLRKYYRKEFPIDLVRITLIQNDAELLTVFSPSTRSRAFKSLTKKGVHVLLAAKVTAVSSEGVTLADGNFISSKTVIWTAGVRANSLTTKNGLFPLDRGGRLQTENTLQITGFPEVFALGDVAAVSDGSGKLYPMLAQIAVSEAKHLGKNIALQLAGKKLLPFTYVAKGELVSLGQWEAAGTIAGLNLYGKFAWFVWRTVYLFKFISKSKKLKIAVDWTVHIFFPRDVTSA